MSFNIGDYLKKFVGLVPPDDFIKEKVIEIIKNKINIELNKKEIELSNRVVYIKTKSIIKNEIFIQKQNILNDINNDLENKLINDIR